MANAFNRIISRLVLWGMKLLEPLGPWPALIVVSLLLALLVLAVYRMFGDAEGLRRARNVVVARVLELRLFKDDVWSIGGSLWRVLGSLAKYMGRSLKILLILVVPVTLLLVQLEGWFGGRALRPGEQALLTVQLRDAADAASLDPDVSVTDGLEVETPAFHWPAGGEFAWRVRAIREGDQRIDLVLGDERWVKTVAVDSSFRGISRERVGGFWVALAHPFERSLSADGPLRSIRVSYPSRRLSLAGRNVHWLVALFVLTMAFALVLKRPMRVEM